MPKTKRYVRRRIRGTFRRITRRIDKGQYHSDDGYTSDPGPPLPDDHHEEDEETDGADSSEGHGQGAESRTVRQIKLERKLEKTKNQLELEREHYQVTQSLHRHDLETSTSEKAQQRIKSRLLREQLKAQAAVEQNRKKIEKYEKDLVLLQEGGAKEGRLRGKIEGGLKAPFVGIKKGFNIAGNTLKKGKRYIIRTRSSQGGELGEGELDGDGKYAGQSTHPLSQ
jgi:hypothetical protein